LLKHYPKGKFIRRYLPELKNIPDAFIHEPWHIKNIQNQYFKTIVNHDEGIIPNISKNQALKSK
jgi:deoxyribodipyrimidine photolyase